MTLRIETDEGIYGLGDGTLNGRELAVASYLTEHVIPCLIGRDPFADRGHLAVPLSRRVLAARAGDDVGDRRGGHGAVGHQGQGAEHAGVQPAGGQEPAGRAGLHACQWRGHRRGGGLGAEAMDEGYLAVRAQAGVPGVASSYGVPKGGKPYEPAERGLPGESLWSTERYLNFAPKLFEAVARRRVGEDVHLLHDVHHRLTPIEAARLGKSLEPYHLFWMEDPVPAELQEGFKLIRQHTTTPIATGEVFNSYLGLRMI